MMSILKLKIILLLELIFYLMQLFFRIFFLLLSTIMNVMMAKAIQEDYQVKIFLI